MRRPTLLVVAALAFLLGGCSSGSGAARTIEVRMSDDMRFSPNGFEFAAGDVVTFQLSNVGAVTHEMFIGDRAAHDAHAAEMRDGGHAADGHDDPAAVSVEPGATGTLTYTFETAGELLAACHEPGHYEAGMLAPITVRPPGTSRR